MNQKTPPRSLSALLLIFGSLALPGSSMAQESPQDPTLEEGIERPRALPTILHLVDGAKLRVRACQVGAQWEIQQQQGWTQIPSSLVQRAVLESSLLKEARKLERESSRQLPVQRAAYAEWLANEGLALEALKELDRLLKDDPELEAARGVIARQNFSLGFPEVHAQSSSEEIRQLTSAALQFGPAGREAAAQRLSQLEPSPAIQHALLQDLVNSNASRRSFAALGLRRAATGQHMQPLMQRALMDRSEEVRTSAALALGASGDPKLIGPLLRVMDSKSSTLRMNASSTLGNMGLKAAVAPLLARLNSLQSSGDGRKPHSYFFTGNQQAYVQDFDVEVASNAAIADPIVNVLTDAVVLDVAVLSASERPIIQERATIRRALSKLTGASPGTSTRHWMQWWDKNRADYESDQKPVLVQSASRAL